MIDSSFPNFAFLVASLQERIAIVLYQQKHGKAVDQNFLGFELPGIFSTRALWRNCPRQQKHAQVFALETSLP